MNSQPQPPKWLQQFFRWYCNVQHQEHLEGDLLEMFERRAESEGIQKARWNYFRDVLELIRPFTLRRQSSLSFSTLIISDMFFNHLKIAFRNLRRNYSHTLINVLGLSLGFLVALIIFLKVGHDLNFDRNLADSDQMYRIVTHQGDRVFTGIPGPIPEKLSTELPGAESLTVINRNFGELTIGIPQSNDKVVRIKETEAAEVWPEHFEIFQYDWLAGDPKTALLNPNTAVVSRSAAQKYFGTVDVLGKTIDINETKGVIINGVIENPPLSTNFPFHLLISRSGEKIPEWMTDQWFSFADQFQGFVKLSPTTKVETVEAQMAQFIKTHLPPSKDGVYSLKLQPVKEMHLTTKYQPLIGSTVSPTTLWALILIGSFLLLSGAINFVNLNTARLFQRAKEVGLRKVLGSTKPQIFGSVMVETGLILLSSFILAALLLPETLENSQFLIGEKLSISLISELNLGGYLIGLILVSLLLAGLYPAYVMSKINPIQAMKNQLGNDIGKGVGLRKGLLIVQFSISQTLIICTLIAMNQMSFFHDAPLGFDETALVELSIPTEDIAQLQRIKTQLLQAPGIQQVGFSNTGAASENYWKYNFSYFPSDSDERVNGYAQMKLVDDSYLSTYGMELLAGENFVRWDSLPYAIVNEQLLQEINMGDPSTALGTQISCGGKNYQITGVVKDFYTQSLHSEKEPVVIIPSVENTSMCGIKLRGDDLKETLSYVETIWVKEFPDKLFKYTFLDESIAAFYEEELRATSLFQIAAAIAILIGMMGLVGLVTLSMARRTKEIGIRKVLGASISHILTIFSREFVVTAVVSFLVAVPIAWYAMNQWLEGFAYRIAPQWNIFALAFLLSVSMVLFVVGIKSYRAAALNPVDAIRDE